MSNQKVIDKGIKLCQLIDYASGPSSLNYRVEPFELDACIGSSEVPVNRLAGGIALLLHARTSCRNISASWMRRSKHCRLNTLNSISAILSQLPCLGV